MGQKLKQLVESYLTTQAFFPQSTLEIRLGTLTKQTTSLFSFHINYFY